MQKHKRNVSGVGECGICINLQEDLPGGPVRSRPWPWGMGCGKEVEVREVQDYCADGKWLPESGIHSGTGTLQFSSLRLVARHRAAQMRRPEVWDGLTRPGPSSLILFPVVVFSLFYFTFSFLKLSLGRGREKHRFLLVCPKPMETHGQAFFFFFFSNFGF